MLGFLLFLVRFRCALFIILPKWPLVNTCIHFQYVLFNFRILYISFKFIFSVQLSEALQTSFLINLVSLRVWCLSRWTLCSDNFYFGLTYTLSIRPHWWRWSWTGIVIADQHRLNWLMLIEGSSTWLVNRLLLWMALLAVTKNFLYSCFKLITIHS